MGCMKLDISPASGDIDVRVKEVNDISFTVNIIRKKICKCMNLLLECINDIFVGAKAVNDEFSVEVNHAYPAISLDIGLVCKTNTDTECYLELLDGCLLTVEGCYVKVMKP